MGNEIAAVQDELWKWNRLTAENERLRVAFINAADQLERLAFTIPPPNVFTPKFVQLANAMRNAIVEQTAE